MMTIDTWQVSPYFEPLRPHKKLNKRPKTPTPPGHRHRHRHPSNNEHYQHDANINSFEIIKDAVALKINMIIVESQLIIIL